MKPGNKIFLFLNEKFIKFNKNIMRKLKLFVTILISIAISFSFISNEKAFGQKISIEFIQPPPGKLGIPDLWKATIINNTKETYRVYFYGTLKEEKAGLIATATTVDIDIKPGTNNLKASDFPTQPDLSYPNSDLTYKESLIRTGNIPSGGYEYSVYVRMKENNEELSKNSIRINTISLVSPKDGETINYKMPLTFTWMSNLSTKNANYTITVVEVKNGQSPKDAFKKNTLWFEKKNIKANSYLYPEDAKSFEIGKKYAWKISLGKNISELFTFEVSELKQTGAVVISLIPTGNCCYKMYVWQGTGSFFSSFKFMSGNISTANSETGYSIINQNLPTDFVLKTNNSSSFPVGANSFVGTVCFSSSSNPIPITIGWSTNNGSEWTNRFDTTIVCGSIPNGCPNNIIRNWSFIDGAVQGDMIYNGSVNEWTRAYNSPDVNIRQGCDLEGVPNIGFINMWGNRVVGEAIQQDLLTNPILSGHTYRVKLCMRKGNDPYKPLPVQFEIRASNDPLDNPNCDPGCDIIGITPAISTTGTWTQITLPNWFATYDYRIITISPTNSSSAYNGDSTSNGHIDNICIYEVPSTDCHCGIPLTPREIKVTPASGQTTTLTCMNYYSHYGADPTLNFRGFEYLCTPSGIPSTGKWEVYENFITPSNKIFSSPPGMNFTYDFNNSGIYFVKFYSMCCGEQCDTCSIGIRRDTSVCLCNGHWNSTNTVTYLNPDNIKQQAEHVCGSSSLPQNVLFGSPVNFQISPYNCQGSCEAIYQWSLIRIPSNFIESSSLSYSNIPIYFTPQLAGQEYIFKIVAICGPTVCDSCQFGFHTTRQSSPCGHWDTIGGGPFKIYIPFFGKNIVDSLKRLNRDTIPDVNLEFKTDSLGYQLGDVEINPGPIDHHLEIAHWHYACDQYYGLYREIRLTVGVGNYICNNGPVSYSFKIYQSGISQPVYTGTTQIFSYMFSYGNTYHVEYTVNCGNTVCAVCRLNFVRWQDVPAIKIDDPLPR